MSSEDAIQAIRVRLRAGLSRRVARLVAYPSWRRLERLKGDQRQRFEDLAPTFRKLYLNFRDVDLDRFLIQMWSMVNARLERDFDPYPPFNFLSHPTVSGQMVMTTGGSMLAEQVRLLERTFDRALLRRTLEEDLVGEPLLQCARYLTSHNNVHTLYHLAMHIAHTRLDIGRVNRVVDWGGGYGCMAKLFSRLRPGSTYTIVDTPLFSCLQWLYLSTALGADRVNLLTTGRDRIVPGSVNLVPVHLVEQVEMTTDLFISTWALSESTLYSQDHVIARNWFGAAHILLTFAKVSFNGVPNANRLAPILRAAHASVITAPLQVNDSYALR